MKRALFVLAGSSILAVAATVSVSPPRPGAAAAPAAAPTFAKDVAPILNANCVSCHRPGEIGPMSFLSLRDDAAVGPLDQGEGGVKREMPPWAADPRAQHEDAQRPQPVAEGDRHDRGVGGRRRAARQPGRPAGRARPSPAAGSSASPTSSSSSRSSGRSSPTRRSRTSTSTRRFRSPRTSWRAASRSGPSNFSVVHHSGVYIIDIPDGYTVKDGYLYDPQGKQVPPTEPMGKKATAATATPLAGADKLISYVPGRGYEQHPDGLRQAHSRRQVRPLGDALQPHRPARERPQQARALVGQGRGAPRGAEPAGRRSGAGQRRPRPLLRAGQGSALRVGRHHRPARQDADDSALRGQLQDDGHHAGQRADHALRADAAHAPARQEHEVVGHLSRRPRGDDPRRAQLRLQLADPVRAGDSRCKVPAGSKITNVAIYDNSVEQPVEPGAREGSLLVASRAGTRCTSRRRSSRSTARI